MSETIDLTTLSAADLQSRIDSLPSGSAREEALNEQAKRRTTALKSIFASYVASKGWSNFTVTELDGRTIVAKAEVSDEL